MSNRRKPRQTLRAPRQDAEQPLDDLARARRFLRVLVHGDAARIAAATMQIRREAPWAFGLVVSALWASLTSALGDDQAEQMTDAALAELIKQVPR